MIDVTEKDRHFIVLGRAPGDNALQGVVENSFSMGLSKDRVEMFWSGTAYSNFGTTHELNGRKTADEYRDHFAERHPGMELTVWDVADPKLPVTLDYDQWRRDSERSDKTLSGVVNKYGARNLKFEVRDVVSGVPFPHEELFCYVGKGAAVVALRNTDAGTYHSAIWEAEGDAWRDVVVHETERAAIRAVTERQDEL